MTIDVDRLPPTAYLVLEVLAARYHLGEELWPFPTSVAEALHRLDDAGLISRMHGNTPKTVRARLTEAGKSLVLSERPRQALRLIAELATDRAELVPGMREIAEVARRGLGGAS